MTGALSYEALAERLVATGIVTDPWLEGRPRFRVEPARLARPRVEAMYRAAEALAAAFHELALLCAREEALLEGLALTPAQRAMWLASAPRWHGIARADVFETADGRLQICELNSDTPTG